MLRTTCCGSTPVQTRLFKAQNCVSTLSNDRTRLVHVSCRYVAKDKTATAIGPDGWQAELKGIAAHATAVVCRIAHALTTFHVQKGQQNLHKLQKLP